MNTRTLDVALRIAADLDGAAKEVDGLHSAVDGLKGAGQNAAQGLNAAATAANKNATADKASAAAAQANATAQKALGVATQKTAQIQQFGAISAKQHAQAMRQLPAQITDIVTGLASGQSVFMVAIQQGGQLKDSFGGVVPAAKALLGTITPTVVAVTAGAAAFGIMGMALKEAYEDEQRFTQGLLETGNYAGVTVGALDAMVASLSEVGSVSKGTARDALQQVAASGRFAGEQFDLVARAAARMEAATGQSIDTTVQKFEEIARDPVAALLKLNETEHFLTAAQLERVRALVEEGREQDAAAEGARIYAGRLEDIADSAEAARPHLASMWAEAKKGASDAWEETKNFAEFLAATGEKFNQRAWYQKFGPAGAFNFIRDMYSAEPAAAAEVAPVAGAVDSAEEKRKEEARKKREQERQQFMAAESRYLSDAARKTKELADVDALRTRGVISQEEAIKRKQQIEESYARRASKGSKKSDAEKDQEAAARELENLTKQVALVGSLADGEKRVSEEARVRYEVENGAYKLASATTKQQLIDQAKLLDARRAEREEAEKKAKADEDARKAYERLRAELATPAESTLQQITDQVKALNDALRVGGETLVPEYQAQLARIFDSAYTKAPKFQSPYAGMDDVTGLLGDQQQLDGYLQRLNEWYAQQQAIIAAGRASNAELNAQWDAQEERLSAEHAARLAALTQAQRQMQLAATQQIFDSMASIMLNSAGEQSRAYQIMFAISKGFAIAQAAINLARSVSEASAQPWPLNLPAIANAFAQGAQIAAMIAGANFRPAGYAEGGYTGPGGKYQPAGIVHKGEGVLNQEDIRALGGPAGFHALRHAIHNGYADGGLVMPTERAELLPRLGAPAASPASLQSDMTLYLLQDRDALARALASHPAMRKAIVAEVSDNGNAIQASWSN